MTFHAPLIIDIAGTSLTKLDRQRLKHWQRHFHEQIALADDLLLPQQSNLTA